MPNGDARRRNKKEDQVSPKYPLNARILRIGIQMGRQIKEKKYFLL